MIRASWSEDIRVAGIDTRLVFRDLILVDKLLQVASEIHILFIIQCIEMRIDPSQNKIVNLLKEIKRFNEEYSWDLGQNSP